MTDTFRALCAELAQQLDDALDFTVSSETRRHMKALVANARAALAQPEPEGPTDDELDELWFEIDGGGAVFAWQPYARAAIARWGRPAIKPVPVSEKPGPKDCDGCGNCWWFRQATRDDFPFWWFGGGDNASTHWLPHHALPVPTTRREEN